MKFSKKFSLVACFVLVLLFLIGKYYASTKSIQKIDSKRVTVVIISMGKGDIVNAMTLIKSLVMFTSRIIDLYLFVDDNAAGAKFDNQFARWPEHVRRMLNVKYLTAMFPVDNEVYWKMHFPKYLTLKLYLPELLYSLDAVLLLDSDAVFLNDIAPLWDKFAEFNATQMIGVGTDAGWGSYGPYLDYPYYGDGINSGVMLMNLTRLRGFELRKQLESVYINYTTKIRIAEQCLFNIIFANKPEAVFELNCVWNYMIINCWNTTVCKPENDAGIKMLHGAGKVFLKDYNSMFKMIHQIFIKFDLHSKDSIYNEVRKTLDSLNGKSYTDCLPNHKHILRGLKHYGEPLQGDLLKPAKNQLE